MHEGFSIVEVVTGRGPGGPGKGRDPAEYAMQAGLHEALAILVGLAVLVFRERGEVPPGFVSRFAWAAHGSTEGKLADFLWWCGLDELGATSLGDVFREGRSSSKGPWLRELGQLRNDWVHPKETPRDRVLEEVRRRLEAPPEAFDEPRLVLRRGEVLWRHEGGTTSLHPFASGGEDRLLAWRGLDRDGGLLPRDLPGDARASFLELWKELRALDRRLEDPTEAEFLARLAGQGGEAAGERPWCMDRLLGPGPIGALVEPRLGRELVAAMPRAAWVELGVGDEPASTLARSLGLGNPLTPSRLAGLVGPDRPVGIGLGCEGGDSSTVLAALHWLADLREAIGRGAVRVFVGRSAAALEDEEGWLLDRLPEDIPGLLRAPLRRPGSLSDYVWGMRPSRRRWPWFR